MKKSDGIRRVLENTKAIAQKSIQKALSNQINLQNAEEKAKLMNQDGNMFRAETEYFNKGEVDTYLPKDLEPKDLEEFYKALQEGRIDTNHPNRIEYESFSNNPARKQPLKNDSYDIRLQEEIGGYKQGLKTNYNKVANNPSQENIDLLRLRTGKNIAVSQNNTNKILNEISAAYPDQPQVVQIMKNIVGDKKVITAEDLLQFQKVTGISTQEITDFLPETARIMALQGDTRYISSFDKGLSNIVGGKSRELNRFINNITPNPVKRAVNYIGEPIRKGYNAVQNFTKDVELSANEMQNLAYLDPQNPMFKNYYPGELEEVAAGAVKNVGENVHDALRAIVYDVSKTNKNLGEKFATKVFNIPIEEQQQLINAWKVNRQEVTSDPFNFLKGNEESYYNINNLYKNTALDSTERNAISKALHNVSKSNKKGLSSIIRDVKTNPEEFLIELESIDRNTYNMLSNKNEFNSLFSSLDKNIYNIPFQQQQFNSWTQNNFQEDAISEVDSFKSFDNISNADSFKSFDNVSNADSFKSFDNVSNADSFKTAYSNDTFKTAHSNLEPSANLNEFSSSGDIANMKDFEGLPVFESSNISNIGRAEVGGEEALNVAARGGEEALNVAARGAELGRAASIGSKALSGGLKAMGVLGDVATYMQAAHEIIRGTDNIIENFKQKGFLGGIEKSSKEMAINVAHNVASLFDGINDLIPSKPAELLKKGLSALFGKDEVKRFEDLLPENTLKTKHQVTSDGSLIGEMESTAKEDINAVSRIFGGKDAYEEKKNIPATDGNSIAQQPIVQQPKLDNGISNINNQQYMQSTYNTIKPINQNYTYNTSNNSDVSITEEWKQPDENYNINSNKTPVIRPKNTVNINTTIKGIERKSTPNYSL